MIDVTKMEVGAEAKMNDGTTAYLSMSKRYFVRREPKVDKWTSIRYYNIETLDEVALAKAKCGDCGDIIQSKHCGDYVGCSCGKSFVDTDRWMPERHRWGGNCIEV